MKQKIINRVTSLVYSIPLIITFVINKTTLVLLEFEAGELLDFRQLHVY